MGDHEDISMALSQGPSGIMGDSADEELEEELNELLKEDERKRAAVTRPQSLFSFYSHKMSFLTECINFRSFGDRNFPRVHPWSWGMSLCMKGVDKD